MNTKKVISVDGSKGGVGKSIVSSAVIDTALVNGKSVLLIEADTNNPDVGKSYESIVKCLPLCLDTANGLNRFASEINSAEEEIIVVNNPARSNGLTKYGQEYIEMMPHINCEFTTIWVASGNPDCFEKFLDFNEIFTNIKKVICKNLHYQDEYPFSGWNSSQTRTELLEAGIEEISFPAIATRLSSYMRTNRKTWSDFTLNNEEFGYVCEAQRARRVFQEVLKPYII